ncbi:DUF2798 domain-containing protein [Bacillus inaquosorum]|uniref:DUF2798 domain-containing protein n=1 Tax=Bacillus inaquosorum TaxID=483913 RepID=UPI003F15366B
MPTNQKEGLIFGVMMCFGMVCVMSIYNAIINGAIQDFSLVTVFEMIIGFMVALLLDLLLVGPLAKKIAFSLPFNKSKKLYVILAMSTCMVIGMVLCMSVFGLVTAALSNGINGGSIFSAYLMIVLKNFILAYPLQLLIMGPLVRGIFMKFVKPKLTAAV